ncbi:MAG: sigma-70 family polymerase sigma factor, partial [Conexibacter sp.]|nr:sigma-70 family polymerase sigma factor [Conexibacter sp.]
GAATGGAGGGASQPLIDPNLGALTQAPASTPPPTSVGGVVSSASGTVGQTVGGQAGGAVQKTGEVLGGTVDKVTEGATNAVGTLLGGGK